MQTDLLKFLIEVIKIFVWIIIVDAFLMSIPIIRWKRKRDNQDEYQIDATNQIDYQDKNQCAGFASAYVLRHFHVQKDGNSMYKEIPIKLFSGDATPLGIRILLRKYGFKTKYYKGTVETLKEEIKKGVPVIVFVHTAKQTRIRHFVPVTGYDSEGFFLAESIENYKNVSDEKGRYNRKVSYSDFKKMWNIRTIYMPFYSNTYITIAPR